jgi:hypothetical protein
MQLCKFTSTGSGLHGIDDGVWRFTGSDRIVSQVLLLAFKWASGLTAIERFQPSFPIGETALDEQRPSRIQDRRCTQHLFTFLLLIVG